MHVIRHHNKGMQLIPAQFLFSVPQRRYDHLCDFWPPQKQRAIRTCVQEPVNRHECLAGRDKPFRWEYAVAGKTPVQPECDKEGLLDYVPMWQPPFIVPHTCFLWLGREEALMELEGGQYCPPSNLYAL